MLVYVLSLFSTLILQLLALNNVTGDIPATGGIPNTF